MKDLTILEISSFLPEAVNVFESFGIDYYRKGHRSLLQACLDCKTDFEEVSDALAELEFSGSKTTILNYFEQDLERLISHIKNRFHTRERMTIAALESGLQQAVLKFPEKAGIILTDFKALSDDFLEHTKHEEENLFPYILKMETASRNNDQSVLKTLFHNDLSLYEEEHDDSIEGVKDIYNKLIILYKINNDVLIDELISVFSKFRSELSFHLHLENNIVFPKARLIEAKLRSRLQQAG